MPFYDSLGPIRSASFFSMRFSDILAVSVTIAVLVWPVPKRPLTPLYPAALAPALAQGYQAYLAQPTDGTTVERLVTVLLESKQADFALQVAVQSARNPTPAAWQAMRAASMVYAERLFLEPALKWAEAAISACDAVHTTCHPSNREHLKVYATMLMAGIDSGIHPRLEPERFREALRRAFPVVHSKKP